MVAAHNAAMDCAHRALNTSNFDVREQMLKHQSKLMSIFTRQVEVLDKHRGKGQQTVTVQHVHVASGGQAVVGNIEAGKNPAAAKPTKSAPSQITQSSSVPFEMTDKPAIPVERSKDAGKHDA